MPSIKSKSFPHPSWLQQLSVMTERLIKKCCDQGGSQSEEAEILTDIWRRVYSSH